MEAIKRNIKSGNEYDSLFPRAKGGSTIIKRDANVSHTVSFIPRVVKNTLHHTTLIAPLLKGKNLNETCNKIWQFVYDHITYEKDAHGMEQIRSPARAWADRKEGVDCDCYTTFISSILTNLRIPHTLRITKYKEDRFQHIYPIVPDGNGNYITVDCVVHQFDYEEPYTQKKDYNMDLQYLDGVNDDDLFSSKQSTEDNETGELGKKGEIFKKIGTAIKKATHVVNRVNPATVLLRNGLLASMKLNLMKVAGKLKWAYLTEAQAKQKGIIMDKYHKLKQVLTKLEQVFFSAGGKPENLKKAILTGKGNSDKTVLAGLEIDDMNNMMGDVIETSILPMLLGADLYNSENMDGVEGLGEPVTAAAITAASGAVATIAALIKNIGDIFPKGDKKNESGQQEGDPKNEKVEIEAEPESKTNASLPALSPFISSGSSNDASNSFSTNEGQSNKTSGSNDDKAGSQDGFWDKNKKWLKPTLWGVGGLTTFILGYKAFFNKPNKKEHPMVEGLEGSKKNKGKNTSDDKEKKTPIALM